MAGACDQLAEVASAGVGPALRAVDCIAGEFTALAFGRLFTAGGAMEAVLTALLTLYIAIFAFSLLTGRSHLGLSALTPRMLTLGLVLTFATSWIAYQGVMWNLAVGGPDWIASILTGFDGSATQIFGDRIDLVFAAIAQSAGHGHGATAARAGAQAAVASSGQGLFTPESVMWLGGLLLLLGTVGVLLTARIALAVLMALGPVFVVMALFGGTRGLTAGWLRGVVMTAITPLFVVLGGSITLEFLVPIVRSLSTDLIDIDGRAGLALFLVAAVHCALMIIVFKVAGTVVSGWQVFGLATPSHGASPAEQSAALVPAYTAPSGLTTTAEGVSRSAALVSAISVPVEVFQPPRDLGARSERRMAVHQVIAGNGSVVERGNAASRVRGIGSRLRPVNDTTRRLAKEMIR